MYTGKNLKLINKLKELKTHTPDSSKTVHNNKLSELSGRL